MTLRIHLSIIQPPGYVHSQGFLDQARFARYQFRQFGAEVTIGKNRLREDSINIIFGAHLGFEATLKERYTCVFFNLEQLGEGGARVSQDYMTLLRSSAVIDYDERNLAAYGCKPGDVPVVSFQYAPYLATTPALPLADRPIDLLFFGSINERRKAIFSRIEACGWSVSTFDHPLYGQERDEFIRQAKAVFNCHFYESSRFEQARAFHTLSLGTPVISERTERTTPPQAFEDAVTWVSDASLEKFFREEFLTSSWIDHTQSQLHNFTRMDALPAWSVAYDYCQAVQRMMPMQTSLWHPEKMCITYGSEELYKTGWLNVDINKENQSDVLIDWCESKEFPLHAVTKTGIHIELNENQLDKIYTRYDLTQTKNISTLLGNLLRLLKPEGQLEIEIPYENLPHFIQGEIKPTIATIDSLLRMCKKFWELGSLQYKFEIKKYSFVDMNISPCNQQCASGILFTLVKIVTSPRDRTNARIYMSNFGIKSDLDENQRQPLELYCTETIN